jgi:hypothetical protein
VSLCAACGAHLPEDKRLCGHHEQGHGDGWAAGNRVMCGFVHRKVVPARLAPADRDDDFWHATGDDD